MVRFLALDPAAAYITGQCVAVDGGKLGGGLLARGQPPQSLAAGALAWLVCSMDCTRGTTSSPSCCRHDHVNACGTVAAARPQTTRPNSQPLSRHIDVECAHVVNHSFGSLIFPPAN